MSKFTYWFSLICMSTQLAYLYVNFKIDFGQSGGHWTLQIILELACRLQTFIIQMDITNDPMARWIVKMCVCTLICFNKDLFWIRACILGNLHKAKKRNECMCMCMCMCVCTRMCTFLFQQGLIWQIKFKSIHQLRLKLFTASFLEAY